METSIEQKRYKDENVENENLNCRYNIVDQYVYLSLCSLDRGFLCHYETFKGTKTHITYEFT